MKVLSTYKVESEQVVADVQIVERENEYLNSYELEYPHLNPATRAVLEKLKERIIEGVDIKISDIVAKSEDEEIRRTFSKKAKEILKKELPDASEEEENFLAGRLMQEMLGLGDLELMLADPLLEEVIVNSAHENVWVYHRKFGWLKSNVRIATEAQVQNYAEIIGRKIGRQITTLNPLMDANLLSGNRVNAVLLPIASKGNSIVIRKFRADPWTIVNLIDPAVKTLNAEVAALLWLCVQYEMNIIVGGGTGSGKTSFLNAILLFTPPNQRTVSIEDTRELVLPEFQHWTPMVTRQPNTEGKGEITMLDLMVNSLRMRPDRIVLGETRRQREAEVLFEAMHTGHSVFSTFHAEDVFQLKNRLVHPPINIPELLLSAINLIVIQYRQRRTGFRRVFEIAEFLEEEDRVSTNTLYRWNPQTDALEKVGESIKLYNTLSLYTGMTPKEINAELKERAQVLEYMLRHEINSVNDVGKVIAHYYRDKPRVLRSVQNDEDPAALLSDKVTDTIEAAPAEVKPPTEKEKAAKEAKSKESRESIRKKLKAILGEK